MKLDSLAKLKRDTICVGCTYIYRERVGSEQQKKKKKMND